MSVRPFPEPTIVMPTTKHTHTVVMLHGRGSTGADFREEFFETIPSEEMPLYRKFPSFKWVFLSSQIRHSIVFQEDMSQWYDIYSLTDPDSQAGIQLDGVKSSLLYLRDLINTEAQSVPVGNIVLGGISQGFTIVVLALLMGIGTPSIGPIFGFSSWLPFQSVIVKAIPNREAIGMVEATRGRIAYDLSNGLTLPPIENPNLPTSHVFLAHCADDATISVELGRQMRDVLSRIGHQVHWEESAKGGHWIDESQGITALVSFLSAHTKIPH